MFIAIGILAVIISILLTLIVLIQNPKGGVLSSTFSSMGNQILGANRSTETVEKFTWILAGSLMILCIASIFVLPSSEDIQSGGEEGQKSEIQEELSKNKGTALPSAPAPSMSAPVAPQPSAPVPAAPVPAEPKK